MRAGLGGGEGGLGESRGGVEGKGGGRLGGVRQILGEEEGSLGG